MIAREGGPPGIGSRPLFGLIDRYIGRSILSTTLLVLLVLVTLAGIFGFIGELDDVGTGDYTVLRAAEYVALTLPGMAYLLFAPAALLGSLLGLGALASNSELTVMRAAGVSNGRVVRAVLLTGLVLMLLVSVIGETVMPRAERRAGQLRLAALDDRMSLGGEVGMWIKSGPRFVNIETVLPDYTLLDIDVREFGAERLERAIAAKRATLVNREWWLEDVVVSRIGEDEVKLEREARRSWSDIVDEPGAQLVDADVLGGLSISPDNLSARSLAAQVDYLERNGLDSRPVALAFWLKLTGPLSTLVMLMLSLPFVFGSQRGGGAGQKIFVGILLGITYVLANRLLTQLAMANGLAPFVSALLPLLVFGLVAVVGIRRIA